MALRDQIVELARQQLGNSNIYSGELGRPSEAWCADFVTWLFDKLDGNMNIKNGSVASDAYLGELACTSEFSLVQNLIAYYKGKGQFYKITDLNSSIHPEIGDIVFYDNFNEPGGQYAEHVGIVVGVNVEQQYVSCIGGNESNSVRYREKVYYYTNGCKNSGSTLFPEGLPVCAATDSSGQGICGFGKPNYSLFDLDIPTEGDDSLTGTESGEWIDALGGNDTMILPVMSGHRVKRVEVLQTPWG